MRGHPTNEFPPTNQDFGLTLDDTTTAINITSASVAVLVIPLAAAVAAAAQRRTRPIWTLDSHFAAGWGFLGAGALTLTLVGGLLLVANAHPDAARGVDITALVLLFVLMPSFVGFTFGPFWAVHDRTQVCVAIPLMSSSYVLPSH